ncbi:glycosyltransferase involved in cell wall biogenesis [Rubidibacter lacunae KORDI 51-2]|uniref:Glycosyltransferase involved in cell wall biogenesis n=1 Tax=Rubidibacter lacunae KORDI 51-2 TaxID=582515 RepID=U5DKU3_9CHRO|nr:glycosyltransferase family 2 protein [Rubidibacter lacunae]ERN40345.1 glycosyltransferase involved in cell wall biogenesis [Rubidibacter lacunae KORDI 51-2]
MTVFLSIVIPTFNRATDLELTFASLLEQDYSHYEIVVVDNGPSTDGTRTLVERVCGRHPQEVRYYRTTLAGVTYARSLGNLLARGNVIVQVDDDISLLDTSALSRTAAIFDRFPDVDMLGGLELRGQSLDDVRAQVACFGACATADLHKQDEYQKGIGRVDGFYGLTRGWPVIASQPEGLYRIDACRSCYLAYRRVVLERTGNWDGNYTRVGTKGSLREETDFLVRARACGFRLYYTNHVSFWHRIAQRDSSLPPRATKRNRKVQRDYAAAHSYMAVKAMLEAREWLKLPVWAFVQLFFGRSASPGAAILIRDGKVSALPFQIIGFMGGVWVAMTRDRELLQSAEEWLLTDSGADTEAEGSA